MVTATPTRFYPTVSCNDASHLASHTVAKGTLLFDAMGMMAAANHTSRHDNNNK